MLNPRRWTSIATAVAATTVLLTAPAVGAPGGPAQKCAFMTPKVAKENAVGTRLVNKLKSNPDFTVTTKTVRPEIQRSKGFDGFGRIVLRGQPGTLPVIGAFKLLGTQCGSLIVKASVTSLHHNEYTVRFEAPGEQGNPGRIRLTLISLPG